MHHECSLVQASMLYSGSRRVLESSLEYLPHRHFSPGTRQWQSGYEDHVHTANRRATPLWTLGLKLDKRTANRVVVNPNSVVPSLHSWQPY